MALFVRFCCVFWQKQKVKELSLCKFIARRCALHLKRKACIKKISELELEATMDGVADEAIEELQNVVRANETIEKKLSTTYSLGRDRAGSEHERVMPLYGGNSRSYSFHSANKESFTIFNTLSDTSTSSGGSESNSDGSNAAAGCQIAWMLWRRWRWLRKARRLSKRGLLAAQLSEFELLEGLGGPKSRFDVSEDLPFAATMQFVGDEGFEMGRSQGGMSKKGMWLKRRTSSSSN